MKKCISSSLCIILSLLYILSPLKIHASELNFSNAKIQSLINDSYSLADINKIESDIKLIEKFHVDMSYMYKIEKEDNAFKYYMNYDGIYETITTNTDNNKSKIIVNSGSKRDVLELENNSTLLLDNKRVTIITIPTLAFSDVQTYGNIYKGTKSLSPYGSLTESSYNKFLSSGTQNISLGKALDAVTVTALAGAISLAYGFVGITASLISTASAIASTLSSVNAKTETLGYKYTTYTCGASDYKYINYFYANTACTGSSYQKISYEHFIIY